MDIIVKVALIHEKVVVFIYIVIACDPAWQTWTGSTNSDCISWKNDATAIYYRFENYCTQNCPSGYAK